MSLRAGSRHTDQPAMADFNAIRTMIEMQYTAVGAVERLQGETFIGDKIGSEITYGVIGIRIGGIVIYPHIRRITAGRAQGHPAVSTRSGNAVNINLFVVGSRLDIKRDRRGYAFKHGIVHGRLNGRIHSRADRIGSGQGYGCRRIRDELISADIGMIGIAGLTVDVVRYSGQGQTFAIQPGCNGM